MYLFQKKDLDLNQVKEIGFKLEKDMQKITENNLENILGLEFIASEFQLNNLRIDSLAFDNESNSFVIIEFKRGSNYSVIDQGYSYLALMLNNKAEFVQKLSVKKGKVIENKDIDWSQTKVIFMADGFTRYQQESINFKDLPIELWEIKQFSNGIIAYNQIKATNTTESIKTITKSQGDIKEVEKEIKTYSEDDHIKGKPENIIELYEELKNFTLEINSNIKLDPKKQYISFKQGNKNIVSFVIRQQKVEIYLGLKYSDIENSHEIAKDVSNKGHWGVGNIRIDILKKNEILKAFDLIQQAYDKLFK